MLKGIFSEASFYVLENDIYIIYDDSRSEIGYAFLAKGEGFVGEITILVGLEDKEMIKGITIISHHETFRIGEFGLPLDFSPLVVQFVGLKI